MSVLKTQARKIAIAGMALTLSGGLHAAGLFQFAPPSDIALQGGEAQSVPALGNSFADMAQDAAMPVTPPDTIPPAATATPLSSPVSEAAPAPRPDATQVLLTEAPPPVADPELAALAPVAPAERPAREPAETLTPIPDEVPEVAQTAPQHPSTRPQARPARPAPQRRPEPQPQQRTQAPVQPAGNADQNATRGANTGQQGASTAAAQGQRPAAQGDGGAAASATYGRAVLTQINRTRKQRAPSRGRTVVAFSIAESGGLASVQVVQSSGSPALDQVALDHIRRASPFPPPPSGAQRQFSFEFVGRS
ncbi:MAG: TonB family protein [Rhodobacterales bacterium]